MAGHPVTPRVGKLAVEEAVERPYQQAVDHLGKAHQTHLGKELLENLVQTVGQWWLEEDGRKLEAAREARKAPAAEGTADRCSVFGDGVMAHTDGAWHEVRVGTVRAEREGALVSKSSIALQRDPDAFGDQLWQSACRLGYRGAAVTAFIADGSHRLWNQAEAHFKRAIKIVDFWHVCEHVGKCAKLFLGGTGEARAWALEVCGMLRGGLVEEALEQVERLNPRSSKSRRDAKRELVTYLRNNRGRMDYPPYEAMGLPIGGGEVEAQCKTLVQ